MGISDEIERVAAEFVPVCVLIDALMKQEGVTPSQLSLWLQRNKAAIDSIPVLDFSYEEKNFVWHESLQYAIGDCGFYVGADGSFNYALFANEYDDGFIPGWRSSDLRGFFATTSVEYPKQAIDELLEKEHWRIALDALKAYQRAEWEQQRRVLTPQQQEPQLSTAAPQEAPHGEGKPLSTKERQSLLKLVVGMAIAGYGHDPQAKRSDTVPQIVSDLDGLGISVDEDTVRKYLKKAAETVLPATFKT